MKGKTDVFISFTMSSLPKIFFKLRMFLYKKYVSGKDSFNLFTAYGQRLISDSENMRTM